MIQADKNNNAGFMNIGPFLTKLSIPKSITLRTAEKGIVIESKQDTDRIPWENILQVYAETGFIKHSGIFIELTNGSKLRVYNIKSGVLKSLKDNEVAEILNRKATGQIDDGWGTENTTKNTKFINPEFCSNCGKELKNTDKFCSGCGTPLNK